MKKEPLFEEKMTQLRKIWNTQRLSKEQSIDCLNCVNFNLKFKKCKRNYPTRKEKNSYHPDFYVYGKVSCEYEYMY